MQNDVLAYLNAKRHLNENEREELDQTQIQIPSATHL